MKEQKNAGKVFLVGAGPGDPGLITVRGSKLLGQADVVVYDYLANPRLLSYCPQAELIYVGKMAASHTYTQEEINALLVKQGLAGKKVVRLKGGDPFVFGRGGEECEALHGAGVAFEVVPGITSSIAAPCYAGIPVTHRDCNSSFTLITGHEKEEEYKDEAAKARGSATGSSDLDWSAIAKLPCFAFYMGVKSLPRICEKLIAHGMSPDMPAATIRWGTWPKQRTVAGTVGTIAQKVAEAKLAPPAMTIVGKVVALRETMNWFEKRPLFGQTIVVTRTRQQASDLSEKLEELGANVIEAPTIEIVPSKNQKAVDAALKKAGQFDWVVFTSQNGVKYTKQRMLELGLDARSFGGAKIAVIGEETARSVREELCLSVDLCPDSFVAEALAAEFAKKRQIKGKKFLLLRADIARPLLRERLAESGAEDVQDVSIYETQRVSALPETLDLAEAQWITFTSSSTVRNFIELIGKDYREKLKHLKLASIGPITTSTMQELGLPPAAEAKVFNVDGLVDAILGKCTNS